MCNHSKYVVISSSSRVPRGSWTSRAAIQAEVQSCSFLHSSGQPRPLLAFTHSSGRQAAPVCQTPRDPASRAAGSLARVPAFLQSSRVAWSAGLHSAEGNQFESLQKPLPSAQASGHLPGVSACLGGARARHRSPVLGWTGSQSRSPVSTCASEHRAFSASGLSSP